jgi:hypothetical protein
MKYIEAERLIAEIDKEKAKLAEECPEFITIDKKV